VGNLGVYGEAIYVVNKGKYALSFFSYFLLKVSWIDVFCVLSGPMYTMLNFRDAKNDYLMVNLLIN
jgi:hypothetical protein